MALEGHKKIETNATLLLALSFLVVTVGGIVEIAPLFYLENTIEDVEGMRPYSPLELAGREIYVREGCYVCHSQMIRPMRDEVERYGHYSPRGRKPVRSSVPVGLQADGAGPRPRRRPVFGRVACRPPDPIRSRWCRNR
jgi:hypothetical protein